MIIPKLITSPFFSFQPLILVFMRIVTIFEYFSASKIQSISERIILSQPSFHQKFRKMATKPPELRAEALFSFLD